MKPNLILALLLLTACTARQPGRVDVIPAPAQMTVRAGHSPVPADLQGAARVTLDAALAERLGPEGYILETGRTGVKIAAADSAGVFYARQTLAQLPDAQGLPHVRIEDRPRFAYRGFHVDVSRHFHDKAEIEKLLDVAAFYKFNYFHFHLTDNGGWRLQSEHYPLLTERGAYRVMKDWDGWWKMDKRLFCTADTPRAYGGYYTREDIREIVAYAAARHIQVIPEIEFPAHSDAVFVGYPELSCEKRPYGSGEFCPAEERVYTFMETVLTEVMELFPCKVIHIGADEARKRAWKTCPACQRLMREQGMDSYDDLQCYMVSRIQAFLREHGRTMAGWDELLKNDDLDSGTMVYSYRGEKGGIRAANRGLKAVMTPGEILYCDWYQADPHFEPKAMYGYSPIKKMYRFIPVPDTPQEAAANESLVEARYVAPNSVEYIQPACTANVVGVQGCAWGEYIPTDEHLEYMMFPRLLAVAELAWSPDERRSWADFRTRLPAHLDLLQSRWGLHVGDLHDAPEVLCIDGRVQMEAEHPLAQVRYTLDGSDPTAESPLYTEPFVIDAPVTVRARAFRDGAPCSYLREVSLSPDEDCLNYYPLTYYPS
ncbi:MAG: family 20 glycosylhydrolase [Bacteroidales bacterium]|nr:family 20 glycosylhydrolase [Bacteroidales bacterium]